jgi:hypothetical protein
MNPGTAVTAALATAMRDWPGGASDDVAAWLPEAGPQELRADKLTAPYAWLAQSSRDIAGTPWEAELRRQRRRAAVLGHELALVARRLEDAAIPFTVLRGPALATCYPTGWPREANDIDLLLPSAREIPAALDALGDAGFAMGRPMVCRRDPAAGGAWAGIALRRMRPDLENPVYLDVTAGGPAVGRTACVPIGADTWAERIRVPVHGTEVPVFGPTALALVFAVELMERTVPIGRDLLDFVALAAREPDWEAVRVQVRRHGLGRGLADLAGLADRAGATAEAELLRRLGDGTRRRRSVRGAGLAVADRAYGRFVRRAPNATLAFVERAPARLWYRLGLPVYGYPPRPDRGPLAGAPGAPVAGLPGYRARIRPVARAADVDAVFAAGEHEDASGALTEPELDSWRERLADQCVAGAPEGDADPGHVNEEIGRQIAADGGTRGTVGVRRAGALAAAGRVVDCLHPLTKAFDRRLEGLWAEPEALPSLLALIPRDQVLRATIPVHGPAARLAEPLREAGFAPEVVVVRRPTGGGPDHAGTARVRPAVAADLLFVQECLAAAVRRGLFGQSPEVDLDEWIRTRFTAVSGVDLVCLIAEDGGQPIGHGFAQFTPDRYRSRRCAFIVDVFVVPDRHGEGHARTLTAALSAAVAARGATVLESEVALDGDADTLRANLIAGGWREDRMVWARRPA